MSEILPPDPVMITLPPMDYSGCASKADRAKVRVKARREALEQLHKPPARVYIEVIQGVATSYVEQMDTQVIIIDHDTEGSESEDLRTLEDGTECTVDVIPIDSPAKVAKAFDWYAGKGWKPPNAL